MLLRNQGYGSQEIRKHSSQDPGKSQDLEVQGAQELEQLSVKAEGFQVQKILPEDFYRVPFISRSLRNS